MALTRKLLKGMGLTDEQVDTIIEAHSETVDGLKDQVKTYKDAAERVPDLEKKIKDLEDNEGDDFKGKYEAEKAAHAKTKADYEAKETAAKIKDAYRAVLKEAGIADKYINTAMKATDFSDMKLDKDGKLENAEKLTTDAKTEWADFVVTTNTGGTQTHNPPANRAGGTGKSKEEILSIRDGAERRQAIKDNPDLFPELNINSN